MSAARLDEDQRTRWLHAIRLIGDAFPDLTPRDLARLAHPAAAANGGFLLITSPTLVWHDFDSQVLPDELDVELARMTYPHVTRVFDLKGMSE